MNEQFYYAIEHFNCNQQKVKFYMHLCNSQQMLIIVKMTRHNVIATCLIIIHKNANILAILLCSTTLS